MAAVERDAEHGARFLFGHIFEPLGGQFVDAESLSESSSDLSADQLQPIGILRDAADKLLAADNADDTAIAKRIDIKFRNEAGYRRGGMASRIGPSVMSWLARAGDVELAEFSRWHLDRHAAFQRALDKALPELRDDAMARVDCLIDKGTFYPYARRIYEKVTAPNGPYPVRAMDIFSSAATSTQGYFVPGIESLKVTTVANKTGSIALANFFDDKLEFTGVERLADLYFHEATHAATHYSQSDITYGEDLWGHNTLLDEALTSHLCLDSQSDDAVCMGKAPRGGAYADEQRLVYLTAECGPHEVAADILGTLFIPSNPALVRKRSREVFRKYDENVCEMIPSLSEEGVAGMARRYREIPSDSQQLAQVRRWVREGEVFLEQQREKEDDLAQTPHWLAIE